MKDWVPSARIQPTPCMLASVTATQRKSSAETKKSMLPESAKNGEVISVKSAICDEQPAVKKSSKCTDKATKRESTIGPKRPISGESAKTHEEAELVESSIRTKQSKSRESASTDKQSKLRESAIEVKEPVKTKQQLKEEFRAKIFKERFYCRDIIGD